MLRKENSSGLFTTCCTQRQFEEEIWFSPREVCSAKSKGNCKYSLKHRPNKSSVSPSAQLDRSLQPSHRPFEDLTRSIQLPATYLFPNNSSDNAPLHCFARLQPLTANNIKPTPAKPLPLNNSIHLDKTARHPNPSRKPSLSNLNHFQLDRTKQLRGSTLLNFKQSIVSISVQQSGGSLKVDESVIMVDFFHPEEEKLGLIRSYLQNRND